LDYLHRVCGVIHADIRPENIHLQMSKDDLERYLNSTNMAKQLLYKEKLKGFRKRHMIRVKYLYEWGKEEEKID